MAKRKAKMEAMTCPTGQCGPKCIVMGLLAAAAAAFGLFLLVGGVMKQWSGMPWSAAWTWYFGGFVLMCVKCCLKKKACMQCN